jgi:hypothetical protein
MPARRTPSHAAAACGAAVLHPARKEEPDNGLHLSGIRQRVDSIFRTVEDRLGLESAPGAPPHGMRARIAPELLAYSAGVGLNCLLDRPSRTFADVTA